METLKKLFYNFKKHSKIYIAFAMIITCVFGVMFATNTFAYESDKISYTITTLSGDDFSTYNEINNNNSYIDINYGNSLYVFNSNSLLSFKKYYLCINYIYLDENNNTYYRHSNTQVICTPFAYINGSYRQCSGVSYNNKAYNYNGTYYTQIIPISITSTYDDNIIKFYFNGLSGHFRIYNIDIVSSEDMGLSQYYDTYYSQIEEQYDQLLEDYDTLESEYNDLQDDYDTLQDSYNDLQENGINNIYGGLYASLNNSIVRLYNTSNPSLSYLLTQTPYAEATLHVSNFYVGVTDEIANIVSNDPNHDLVDRCCILYTLHSPMLFNSLTFTRGENNQSRYIYLYFNDNSSETITIYDSGDYETLSVTWFNLQNKYITHIVTDVEPEYDWVYRISNTSDGQAYENGYDKGYAVGYNDHQSSITQAYNDLKDKYSNAYDNGYNAGFEAADRSAFASSGMNNLFNAILSYPVNFIKEVFNFEFMGVNVSAIITFILSLGIVAFIINYFRKH